MPGPDASASPRQTELLERAYHYVLQHGLGDMSLRPLAAAIGSSPRVLLYLFGSKDGLVRALLARARTDELRLLADLDRPAASGPSGDRARIFDVAERLWAWLITAEHRQLLTLWVEGYGRSLVEPDGPWAGFARVTVEDWLAVLGTAQPARTRDTPAAHAERTALLAVLRGALLDLLATDDRDRTTAAVRQQLRVMRDAARRPAACTGDLG
jgi:AcrR family transcriptional regulator